MWKMIIGVILIINMLVTWVVFGFSTVALGQSIWGLFGIYLYLKGMSQWMANKNKGGEQ